MFTAFQLSDDGLKETPVMPKQQRVQTGCFECRRRKRKCDEKKPICGGCMQVCKSELPTCTRPQLESSSALIPRLPCPTILPALLRSPVSQAFDTQQEMTALQALDLYFSHLTTPIDLKLSIFDPLVPVACAHSVIKNALIACGFVILTKKSVIPVDNIMAMYYSKTVSALRQEITKESEKEVLIGAALLLHNFEQMQRVTALPNLTHLRGALALEHAALLTGWPTDERGLRLLESCIYQVVVSTTFGNGTTQVLRFLPDNYVSVLLKILKRSSETLWSGPLWRRSTFLGVSHDLFDIAFRLSQLRRRTPLKQVDRFELTNLDVKLKAWRLPTFQNNDQSTRNLVPPIGLTRTANLYFLACSLFLQKLIQPTLQASDDWVRELMMKALAILAPIPLPELATPVFSWPLIILSCGAWTVAEKEALRRPLDYFWAKHGLGHTLRILKLMAYIWMVDEVSGRGPIGLGIFLTPVP